ncbi:MAG: SpoVR family protein [Thermodesulfobacteriota bacterium]
MELVNQHTKWIMEGCKERARAAGLRFEQETLEYIVTNRDLIELTPKYMIPTLYDYWVHDVEVLKEKGRYELYPNNPYETVINTRPAISYYNDNNPDWLNVMIFYHVLAHIDFFQNNLFFQHTWDDDFCGRALSDKRTIARLRNEKGRWADYVIEFSRSLDNLVGYYAALSRKDRPPATLPSKRLDYYFDIFLQSIKRVKISEYLREIDHYNDIRQRYGESADQIFFSEVNNQYPEFEAFFNKSLKGSPLNRLDPVQYILEHSEFLNREENRWMKLIVQIVRDTSLFFQPQIRTKIMNEGWASFWHEKLFLSDDRIRGHEVDFALVNAKVTSLPRVGLNPYALGMRLFAYIEEMADRGCYDWTFDRLSDDLERSRFDRSTGKGREAIFDVRKYLNDFQFITRYVDQAFVDRHRLFVVEERLDEQRMVWQYIVKSRKAEDYRQMVIDSLYHPPCIEIPPEKQERNILYLDHRFEGKQLVTEFIPSVLIGVSYLWGGPVKLETSEWLTDEPIMTFSGMGVPEEGAAPPAKWKRVLYTMTDRKLTKTVLR